MFRKFLILIPVIFVALMGFSLTVLSAQTHIKVGQVSGDESPTFVIESANLQSHKYFEFGKQVKLRTAHEDRYLSVDNDLLLVGQTNKTAAPTFVIENGEPGKVSLPENKRTIFLRTADGDRYLRIVDNVAMMETNLASATPLVLESISESKKLEFRKQLKIRTAKGDRYFSTYDVPQEICVNPTNWNKLKIGKFRDCSGSWKKCNDPLTKLFCEMEKEAWKKKCEIEKAAEIAAGVVYETGISQSRQALIDSKVNPIPENIKNLLKPYFSSGLLDRVRYRVGAANVNWSLVDFAAFHWNDAHAITFGEIIAFKNNSLLNDVGLWAHELAHVEQYYRVGIDGFAQLYTFQAGLIEEGARNKAQCVCNSLEQSGKDVNCRFGH